MATSKSNRNRMTSAHSQAISLGRPMSIRHHLILFLGMVTLILFVILLYNLGVFGTGKTANTDPPASDTPEPGSTSAPTSVPTFSSGIGPIGISIIVVVLLLLITGVTIFFWRQNKKKELEPFMPRVNNENTPEQNDNNSTTPINDLFVIDLVHNGISQEDAQKIDDIATDINNKRDGGSPWQTGRYKSIKNSMEETKRKFKTHLKRNNKQFNQTWKMIEETVKARITQDMKKQKEAHKPSNGLEKDAE